MRRLLQPGFSATAFSLALALPFSAHVQAQEVDFNIPAQSLASALQALGTQSNMQVLYSADDVQGLRSQAVSGRLSPSQALSQMLVGTGVMFTVQDNTVTLRARSSGDSLELGATTISGKAVESAYGPVDGYVATRSATGTKTDTPILEIPQTINVVTAEQVQTQGARNLTQALRYTPGLNVAGFTDRNAIADEITSRGFAPTPLYLDGAYLPYAGSLGGAPQIDPYTLERIEVLKGPSSVLYGQNQPGGIINMVSKRPTTEQRSQVKLGAGSYDRVNGAFDTSGPIDDQKEFTYRIVGVGKKGGQQVDHTHSERMLLAPSLTWTPNDDTSLTLLAQIQRDDGLEDYQALPMIGSLKRGPNGERIDRDFSPAIRTTTTTKSPTAHREAETAKAHRG